MSELEKQVAFQKGQIKALEGILKALVTQHGLSEEVRAFIRTNLERPDGITEAAHLRGGNPMPLVSDSDTAAMNGWDSTVSAVLYR